MEFFGRYHIEAPPQAVWDGLGDPKLLQACLPGCTKLEQTGPDNFSAVATLKIGGLKTSFHGTLTRTRQNPPLRCTLLGEANAAEGPVTGEAVVVLVPAEGGTDLTYAVSAGFGGSLGQLGRGLIGGAVRQMADRFFARFAQALGGRADGFSPVIWMTGLFGVVLVLALMVMLEFR